MDQRLARPRHFAVLSIAIAIVIGFSLIAPARADTIFPPGTGDFDVTVTINGTTYTYPDGGPGPTIPNVADGDEATITIADATGGPDVNFARLRARQCAADREVSNNIEFTPEVTNRCSSATLGSGSPLAFVDSGPVAPGTTAITINFTVGDGTAPDVEDPIFGEVLPGFDCGAGNPCKIVVNAEVASGVGSSNYVSFPITFGSANAPPTVDAGPAVSGDTGETLALNGTATDPDGDTLTYAWTVTGPCTLGTPAAIDTTVTCTAPGTYTATLAADDGTNPPVTDTTTVTATDVPTNDPPTVDAGPAVSGDTGETLALNGTATDPDGDTLTYAWTVTGPCTLGTPAAIDTTVTCTAPGTYTATLAADDGTNPPVTDTTTVTVTDVPTNDPPTVDAGPAVSGSTGETLALDGTATDPDGDTLTYAWTVTGPCTLGTPAAVDTTVTCTAPGTYTATLAADDGTNPPVSDATTVTVADVPPTNDPPIVDAGPDVSGSTGDALALDGTSTDPDGDPLTHAWTVTGPCTLSTPAAVDTTVTCTAPGTYTATLTADDGTNPAVTDTAGVEVTLPPNDPPTVDAGPDVSGSTNEALSLDGTSTDPDGDPLTYAWTVTGPCTLSTPAAVDTTVTCTAPGTYTATLTVDDGTNPAVTATASVTVSDVPPTNDPPIVDAGPAVTGVVGEALALSGSATDPDGDTLTYAWTVTGPCTLGTPAAVDTTVTCTAPGTYIATLTVDDGTNPVVSDTTTVKVDPVPTGDTRPPRCTAKWVGSFVTQVRVRDTGSGLASVTTTNQSNAKAIVPVFATGTTDRVFVLVKKVNPFRTSTLSLTVADVAGNIRDCEVVMEGPCDEPAPDHGLKRLMNNNGHHDDFDGLWCILADLWDFVFGRGHRYGENDHRLGRNW